MFPILCQMRHDGARHTGRYGFGGRWSRPAAVYALQYHTGTCDPHFLTTAAGWEALKKQLRPAVVGAPVWDGAAAQLLGGYDGLSVFVDECPCLTRIDTDPGLAARAQSHAEDWYRSALLRLAGQIHAADPPKATGP